MAFWVKTILTSTGTADLNNSQITPGRNTSKKVQHPMNMITKFQLGSLACLLITISHVHGEGVLLAKANANQDSKYWRPVGFKRVEQYVASIKALLLDGKEITMDNSSIGEIIEIPDWSMMNASTDAQMALLKQQRDDYKQKAAQYPQVGNWVQSIVSRYDAMLSSKREGFVLAGGRWVEKNKVIEINSKAYTNTRVEAVKNGWVLLKHDGGTTSLPITEISVSVLNQLKASAPDLFTVEEMTVKTPAQEPATAEAKPSGALAGTPSLSQQIKNAIPVADGDFIVGQAQLERGKTYSFHSYVNGITNTVILGSCDLQVPHLGLIPSGNDSFSGINASVIPGQPVELRAVGRFKDYVSTGRLRLPRFECLLLYLSNKEVYRASGDDPSTQPPQKAADQ